MAEPSVSFRLPKARHPPGKLHSVCPFACSIKRRSNCGACISVGYYIRGVAHQILRHLFAGLVFGYAAEDPDDAVCTISIQSQRKNRMAPSRLPEIVALIQGKPGAPHSQCFAPASAESQEPKLDFLAELHASDSDKQPARYSRAETSLFLRQRSETMFPRSALDLPARGTHN